MKQGALRWIRRLLVLGACAGVLGAVIHTPWARGLVLGQLMSRLSALTGLAFTAEALRFNLVTLTAEVDGLQISRPASAAAPILRVRQARLALSHRVLAGTIEAHRVEADGVALVIDLSPRPGMPGEQGAPFKVPVFTVGHALLRHASIEVLDPGGLGHLKVLDVTLELEGSGPRRLEGAVTVAGGLTLDNDDTRARVDRVEGRAFLDGDTIGVKPASAVVGTQRLVLDGSVAFTGPSPRFDLGIAGSADVAQITSWFPALPAGTGPLELTGRVTGPLDNPQFRYSARSAGVTLPDIRLPASTAEGYISQAGIYVERLRTGLGKGWVEVAGRLPLGLDDPNSRFSLTWNDVAIASLARVFPLLPADPIGMVATGSARVHWPGATLEFATVAGEVTSDLRFAPSLEAARVRMTGSAGSWTLHGEQVLDGGTLASVDAAITIDPADVTRSPLLGSLRVASENLKPAMEEAARAFSGLPDASAWLDDSPLAIDAALEGSLGAPRLAGTAASERLRIRSLPALDASATFDVDTTRLTVSKAAANDGEGNVFSGRAGIEFEAGTTTGSFSANLKNPAPILNALLRDTSSGAADDDLKAGGSVVLTGTWDGPVDDPAVAAAVNATDVALATQAFSLERGTVQGWLGGPVSAPKAEMRVSAGAVSAASLPPVPADAVLSLDAGRVEVTAHVPDWSATIDGHVSVTAPHEFAAAVSVADLGSTRLLALLGAQDPAWTVDGTIAAKIEASGAIDSRKVRVGGQAAVAGGALRAGDSPIVDGLDAAMEVRNGRLRLTRLEGSCFNGPLTASGDLPLNWIEPYLPGGWRIDDLPASPAPASFDARAEPDVSALGTWMRPDEPGRMSGKLRLRASGTASAPAIDAVEAVAVVEPDTVTVRDAAFTLAKPAEMRFMGGFAVIDEAALMAPGTTASASVRLELAGERRIDGRLIASGALGFLSSVVPGRVAGEFKTEVRASGTVADPGLTGNLSLDGAAWVWPEQRIAFRDWSGHATLDREAVTIGALNGHLNGGDAEVSGEVRFKGGGRGLTLRVRDAFAEVVKGLRSQADADLTLARAGEGARLSGKVTVTSGAYREPITAMARLFASAPAGSARTESEPSPLGAIALDVELSAAAPIIIENSAGRLDLRPSMKLQGTAAEPALFGSLDMVDEGRLSLLGRTFRLTEGSVVFAGTGDPSVQLIGETRVGDYDVTLRTGGPVSRLEPTFTSEPPLSQRDLQSLLVTGRTTDIAGKKGSDDEDFALGAASSDLLGFAGQMVGLDSVQLGRADFELGASDVDPAMRLTVSKHITGRTRLVLSQDLDNNKFTWIAVFAPKRGYEIRVSQRDNVEEAVEFRQELLFGPGVSPPSVPGTRNRMAGPRVSSVGISGELMYPASELESVLKLRPGKRFDAGRWQEDRARLEAFYRKRGYATARIIPGRTITKDGGTERAELSYRVDHGPRTILQVNGIGLSDDERRDVMRIWSGSVLPEFLDDDISGYLRSLLAERGHLRPSITVDVTTPSPEVVLADVAVAPGPATGTRTLVIEGAREVGEPELRAALSGNPALESAWVDPAALEAAVVALYAQRGYASARAEAEALSFEGDTATRRVRVTEGPRSVVGSLTITGAADARAAEAQAAVELRPGQPLLPGMEADAKRRLERFYLDRGYRSAAVRAAAAREPDGRVQLSFTVAEGPVSIVDAIQVTGLEATKRGVAAGAVTLKPGEPAAQQGVAASQAQLYGLGVFRKADVSFEPAVAAGGTGAAPVPVIMKVSLEEARRYQLRYGVQVSNEYGPVLDNFTSAIGVAADISDRNFLGRAFTLGASGRIEKNLQSSRVQFSLPPMFTQRLQTSVYGTFRFETDTTEESVTYKDKERDLTFEQRLRLPHRMDVSWGYSYNVRDVSLSFQRLGQLLELKPVLGYVTGTFVVDQRDSPFNASRGWFQSSNVQWGLESLGADLNYFRVLLRQFYYRPAGPLVFASGVRWGWLHGLEGVPDLQALGLIDQLFDAGGAQTVRGYAEDSLSAYEPLGAPAGGSKLLLLNQEVRFPLFSKWLQGAAFIDAGNTFKPGTSIKLNELAVGVGWGIRIMTPFAPLRLDVGYPINRRPEDKAYRIYFSVGQIF